MTPSSLYTFVRLAPGLYSVRHPILGFSYGTVSRTGRGAWVGRTGHPNVTYHAPTRRELGQYLAELAWEI